MQEKRRTFPFIQLQEQYMEDKMGGKDKTSSKT